MYLCLIGSDQRILQREHIQGTADPYHIPDSQPERRSPKPRHSDPRKTPCPHRHVLHQHLQHTGRRSQPPIRLQPAFRTGNGQQLHRVVRTWVSEGIAQRFQLVPGHAVRQQRQQLQQAGRICAVRQNEQSLCVVFIPLLSVVVSELGPDSTAAETNANARLTRGLNAMRAFGRTLKVSHLCFMHHSWTNQSSERQYRHLKLIFLYILKSNVFFRSHVLWKTENRGSQTMDVVQ